MTSAFTGRRLFTLAYPTWSAADSERIEAFRLRHDPNFAQVRAHFTMVFGCEAVPEPAYVEHVREVCRSAHPFTFRCRYALLGADDEVERAYVFLVPDEGFSAVARLHDALYRGVLGERLRLDLPYIPHLTIGASADRAQAKRWCDELNAEGLDVGGTVDAVTVTVRDGSMLELATVKLGAA